MLVFVLNQAQKANTGKIQTPVYENVREFGFFVTAPYNGLRLTLIGRNADGYLCNDLRDRRNLR